jgi:hypothetical protein
MFDPTTSDTGAFRQLDVDEIVQELQLEDAALVQALVALRSRPRIALQQRVKAITETERLEHVEGVREALGGRVLPSLSHLALRAGAVAAVLFVAALLLLATVPSVRAAFGRMMQQRFGLVLVEPTPQAATISEPEEGSQGRLTEKIIPPISFAEAQAQVPFAIPLPTLLPEGFELWATRVGTGPHGESMDEDGNRISIEPPVQVILHFKPGESSEDRHHPEATLGLDIMDRTDLHGGYAVPAGSEADVEVNGNPAVFVRGAWVHLDESKPPSPDNMTWDDTADAVMLSWEADGFTYTLSGSHLGLTQEEYIRIAESIK